METDEDFDEVYDDLTFLEEGREKTLLEALQELGEGASSYKFAVCGGQARIAVDGIGEALKPKIMTFRV